MNLIRRFQDLDDPQSLSSRFRRARMRRFLDMVEQVAAEKGAVRIADLGGEPGYWKHVDRALLERCNVRIVLINPEPQATDDPLFEVETGDATDLSRFPDGSFDLVHSNSVVEHVGDWPRMEAFAREVRRLAPRYYVQTPYFWFPIEPHFSAPFFHWRSEQSRARMLMKKRRGWVDRSGDMGEAMRAVQHARLLDKGQFRFLFPDADHHDEKAAGLTKSLIAVRA